MIIDCIGCLHGAQPKLDGGDLLIVTGDLTACDRPHQYLEFSMWLAKQNYKKIILIAGNHDNCLMGWMDREMDNCNYLVDSGTIFEGLTIWGTPHTRWFYGINSHCTAFTGDESYLEDRFSLIPRGTDILVSHGPPHGSLDQVDYYRSVGSLALNVAVERVKPKLVVFSHIHEGYGQQEIDGIKYINCSIMNQEYDPINKPIRIIL